MIYGNIYASLALGEGLPIIGRLLGHRRVETTARHAHLAPDSARESAERIAGGRHPGRKRPLTSSGPAAGIRGIALPALAAELSVHYHRGWSDQPTQVGTKAPVVHDQVDDYLESGSPLHQPHASNLESTQ